MAKNYINAKHYLNSDNGQAEQESYLEFSEERNEYVVKELVKVRLCEVSSVRDESSSHKHITTHRLQLRLQLQLSLRPTKVFCLQ